MSAGSEQRKALKMKIELDEDSFPDTIYSNYCEATFSSLDARLVFALLPAKAPKNAVDGDPILATARVEVIIPIGMIQSLINILQDQQAQLAAAMLKSGPDEHHIVEGSQASVTQVLEAPNE